MIKRHLKKIIIISLSVTALLLVLAFVLPKVIENRKSSNRSKYYTEDGQYIKPELASYIGVIAELNKMGMGTNDNYQYWENWDWETQMVGGIVSEIVPETGDIILHFGTVPDGKSFTNKDQFVTVKCPKEQTVSVSMTDPTQNLTAGGFDFFEEVRVGDGLFSFCLDEECLNLGKACILVKENPPAVGF